MFLFYIPFSPSGIHSWRICRPEGKPSFFSRTARPCWFFVPDWYDVSIFGSFMFFLSFWYASSIHRDDQSSSDDDNTDVNEHGYGIRGNGNRG